MSQRRTAAVACLAAVLLLAAAANARADTGAALTDDQLLLASDLAATGHVLRVEAARDPVTTSIYTYVTIALTDVLRGPGDPVVVLKQLGGRIGSEAMIVFGQAQFSPGEDVLIFAETRPRDGSLYTASLWQGKWTIERNAANARVAVRGAPDRGRGAFGEAPDRRELAPMLQRLRSASASLPSRAAGANLDPDRATAGGARAQAPFTLFETAGRWNEFDSRTAIPIDVPAGGYQGLTGGGIAEIVNAAGLWSAATPLVFAAGDTVSRCSTQTETTGHISIAFMDPCGEISNSSNTIAIGGYYCDFSGGRTVNGVSFCRNTGGFVINNDNTNTVEFYATPACFQAAQTHEIGHALGLAHSTDPAAIMFATISNTCRNGARPLGSDDVAGIRFVYPIGDAAAPGAPSALTATASGSSVTLTWSAPASGGTPSGYLIEAGSSAGLSNLASFNTGSTATAFSADGVPAGSYFVRVKATNAAGTSAPSGEAILVVGGCSTAPGAPGGLTVVSNSGGTVMLSWTAASGSPTSYVVEAGSTPGAADLANSDLGSNATMLTATAVPRGTYYVRARARNSCGTSGVSNEIVIVV